MFDIKYHFVWITKYRYKILRGRVAERARDLLRQVCQARDVVIVRGAVSPDHIHMLASCPREMAPAKLVQYLRGRSSRKLQDEFPDLRKLYWGQHLWAGATFARVWALWMRIRSRNISRVRSGMMMTKDSRSPRPPSIEPAVSREPFRRL